MTVWAPYMEWAKMRPAARFDLAGSNLLGCTLEDLAGGLDGIGLDGPNREGWPPLVEAIAERYGVPTDSVATAPGCTGANLLAFAALIRPGDEVVVEQPAYDPLLGTLRLLGANIIRFERRWEDGWAVDPERVRAVTTSRTRLIVLTSPHNPTGVLVPGAILDDLARLARDLRGGARVLVDEVYLDAVYEGRPPPAATFDEAFVTTNSLTKAYGLSGLRAGWVLASPAVARAARRVRDVVDVSGAFPAEHLARVAFARLDALEARARAILEPNARRLADFVGSRPQLEWVPPDGGTIAFPRVRGLEDTSSLADTIYREHSTAVVAGAFFDAPAHLRIAYGCDTATLEGGLERLAAVLDGL